MMCFDQTLTNPLLQIAVGIGEATIRHACDGGDGVRIWVSLGQFPDGRDAIHVRLERAGGGGRGVAHARFQMVLRNYFDKAVLWRVARRAYLRLAGGAEDGVGRGPAGGTRRPFRAVMN